MALPFHLFGDLWLEDPRQFLDGTELSNLHKYLPLIRKLDSSWKDRSKICWDLDSAFSTLVERETSAWRHLGVDRSPQYLLPPSGSVHSPLACHLFNPTFYVADPKSRTTDDPTSPTLRLLHASGFSSNNCLIFDQVCRREETSDVLWFYTEEIYKPYRDFIRELRENMAAVVEICWGRDAWKELGRHSRVVSFPLWGTFKPVRLYLELTEEGQSLKRFVLHVYHPQFFCRTGLAKLGPKARENFGKVQDLALTVANQLVGNGAEPVNYFQTDQVSRTRCRLQREQELAREKYLQEARRMLETAFPEKYQQRETRRVLREKELRELDMLLQGLTEESSNPMITYPRATIPQDQLELRRREREVGLNDVITSFKKAHRDSLLDDELRASPADIGCLEVIEREFLSWDTLSDPLAQWIQTQRGLRINGEPISDRAMLETAFQLLYGPYCQRNTREFLDVFDSPIYDLAVKVGIGYIKKVTSPRKEFIRNNTIPGSPERVIARQCSGCEMHALDDAFPIFCQNMPERKPSTRL
ncbi:hypothetical protein FQN54_000657 [Arachnomyces sp. PD_36]|nr:hypothetical protein FQN54_000657 [Arachnomyces sp. PD_36]